MPHLYIQMVNCFSLALEIVPSYFDESVSIIFFSEPNIFWGQGELTVSTESHLNLKLWQKLLKAVLYLSKKVIATKCQLHVKSIYFNVLNNFPKVIKSWFLVIKRPLMGMELKTSVSRPWLNVRSWYYFKRGS